MITVTAAAHGPSKAFKAVPLLALALALLAATGASTAHAQVPNRTAPGRDYQHSNAVPLPACSADQTINNKYLDMMAKISNPTQDQEYQACQQATGPQKSGRRRRDAFGPVINLNQNGQGRTIQTPNR